MEDPTRILAAFHNSWLVVRKKTVRTLLNTDSLTTFRKQETLNKRYVAIIEWKQPEANLIFNRLRGLTSRPWWLIPSERWTWRIFRAQNNPDQNVYGSWLFQPQAKLVIVLFQERQNDEKDFTLYKIFVVHFWKCTIQFGRCMIWVVEFSSRITDHFKSILSI